MDYLRDLDLVNSLCKRCMEREGITTEEGSCYICNGLMDRLDEIFSLIKHAIKDYEFETLLIGATLPPEILEREDEVRSRLKIRGRRSIKNEITSTLGKMLNAKVSFRDPDLSIYIDLRANFVSVKARSIYLFGRYKKERRGIEQRSTRCNDCNGIGCHACNFKGSIDISIEGIIAEHLTKLYASDDVKFSWIGGEDEDSLVLNKGRPFFVKIINPRKRSINYKDIKIKANGIDAWFIKQVTKFPDKRIRFRNRFKILAIADKPVDTLDLNIDHVSVKSKNKNVNKMIYDFAIKALDDKSLEIDLIAESGLPVKRFVEGGVDPNISELLGSKIKCKYFDILDVILD